MANVFTLLTAYYIIKPVREALILGGAGAEIKSYAGAGQALLLILIVPAYSAIATRLNRLHLINGVTAFFISNLALFYLAGRMKFSIGVVFFLWVGLFNLMIVAQFWSFANDIYTQEQGKRLFAIVGIGSSVGAIFGAQAAGWMFKPLGPYLMMLVTAAMLGVCMILTNWVHYREKNKTRSQAHVAQQPIGAAGGFQLVFKQRYLLLIAVLVLLSNFAKTTGEFILGKTVAQHAVAIAAASGGHITAEAYIGEFYADFYFWVNLVSAAIQMFAVSRVMKYMGIGAALFCLPVIALGGYSILAFVPILSFIRIAKIAENSADYSIQNTARNALFLRTSREAKYKAKLAIDSFFARAGDGFSALLVFTGTRLAFGIRSFAVVDALSVLIWLGVVVAILRLRRKQKAETAPDKETPLAA
ncbi:MAG TPA: Npt1/Npt2 family nucleotide transporter [Terriglobia bacterium]|jgi:AAA family ATP:ADP antiporter